MNIQYTCNKCAGSAIVLWSDWRQHGWYSHAWMRITRTGSQHSPCVVCLWLACFAGRAGGLIHLYLNRSPHDLCMRYARKTKQQCAEADRQESEQNGPAYVSHTHTQRLGKFVWKCSQIVSFWLQHWTLIHRVTWRACGGVDLEIRKGCAFVFMETSRFLVVTFEHRLFFICVLSFRRSKWTETILDTQ